MAKQSDAPESPAETKPRPTFLRKRVEARPTDAAAQAVGQVFGAQAVDAPPPPEAIGTVPTAPTRAASAAGWQVGLVYDVPLEKIRPNPVNPRAIYTATAVDEMAQSLLAHGQQISATGYADGESVVLIEGHTRLRGCQVAGLQTLRVEIKAPPEDERRLYEEARAINVERRAQTPLDDAVRWNELLKRKVYPSQQALARSLGLDEGDVSRTMRLVELPQRLIQAIAEVPSMVHLRMLSAIRAFWQARGDEETLELILEIEKSGMGFREVDARRKAAERGPTKRPRSEKRPVEFRGAKGELRVFEAEGRVELALKGLAETDLTELQKRLEQALLL